MTAKRMTKWERLISKWLGQMYTMQEEEEGEEEQEEEVEKHRLMMMRVKGQDKTEEWFQFFWL